LTGLADEGQTEAGEAGHVFGYLEFVGLATEWARTADGSIVLDGRRLASPCGTA
jgi:hypothetical protein